MINVFDVFFPQFSNDVNSFSDIFHFNLQKVQNMLYLKKISNFRSTEQGENFKSSETWLYLFKIMKKHRNQFLVRYMQMLCVRLPSSNIRTKALLSNKYVVPDSSFVSRFKSLLLIARLVVCVCSLE